MREGCGKSKEGHGFCGPGGRGQYPFINRHCKEHGGRLLSCLGQERDSSNWGEAKTGTCYNGGRMEGTPLHAGNSGTGTR